MSITCFSQHAELKGIFTDADSADILVNPLTIILFKNDVEMAKAMTVNGTFHFKNLESGVYSLNFDRFGNRFPLMDFIVIKKDDKFKLYIKYECPYRHPINYQPKCPKDDSDKVVPIVYGLPNEELYKEYKNGKVYLEGRCLVTDCDPKYYCPRHKLKF